jgi:hypothetical protein
MHTLEEQERKEMNFTFQNLSHGPTLLYLSNGKKTTGLNENLFTINFREKSQLNNILPLYKAAASGRP